MPATLSDNFNDNSLDTAKWDINAIANQNVSVTVSETGGQQVITPLASTAGTNRNGLTSDSTFNMTQGFVVFQLAQKAGANASVETRCGVYVDASNYISFEVANTTITFRKRDAASNSDTTTTYNSTNHKWLMLMRCGTHWFWYTSADQVTWTQQRASVTSTFAVTAMKLFLDAGTTGSVATITPATAIFDDVSAGTIDFPLPFEQLAAFGGKVDLDIKVGFPLNLDVPTLTAPGETFTIPMPKQRVGTRIYSTGTVITYKATCTGTIDTFDIWLKEPNSSATSAIFNLSINGDEVFSALGRPTITTGNSHVQKTDVGAEVVLGDEITISVEQVPSIGVSGWIDTIARVLVS
jgi:hypothetical protein